MNNNMSIITIIKAFLQKNISIIICSILNYALLFVLCFLYNVHFELAVYFVLLTVVVLSSVGAYKFTKFYAKYKNLYKLLDSCLIDNLSYIKPNNEIESLYQQIIVSFDKMLNEVVTQKDMAYKDMIDYYTIWAHQIKTPISAINLMLQSDESPDNREMQEQIFRVEQYVEMALQYLRMGNMSNDLVIQKYNLDDLVKLSVKKYARSFIRKKIVLDYNELNCQVLTDEKWLQFVIEQILSNALKYTRTGKISIYMDDKLSKTLVIEDTGIGIEQEDLPRVFEKGFTGYNGREDKKSTGLGLYLCKNIMRKLSHTVAIESEVGKGTKVKLGLETLNMFHE